MPTGRPALPDGLVLVMKQECATCRLVEPLVARIAGEAGPLTVWVQDDPSFVGGVGALHDSDLAVSWHNSIETVPTLMVVRGGSETERTIGWSRDDWRRITGIADLGEDLPAMRPGCGSMSVDPDLADELRVR
jgi:hypothetical protein